MGFETIQGVSVSSESLDGVCSAYKICDDGVIDSVLSAELIKPFLYKASAMLEEPHFFFVELPCSEDEEKELRKTRSDPFHYKVYYLDGCTAPVTKAIIDRYGDLLINDGLVRFGFGSNKTNEEIYVRDYQQILVYGKTARYEKAYTDLGIERKDELRFISDSFSPENCGTCMAVEIEGEQCPDIVENLSREGMYYAQTVEF
ncbi:MAG: hypothetical protein IKO27_01915 [Ruminococcus sp.]|nr:hypothetical protein [Ruminococcus sp.]